MNYYIGIDPGKKGAITIIDLEGNYIESYPFEELNDNIDQIGIASFLKKYSSCCKHAILEDVHAVFGSSAAGTFSFGWCKGFLEGVLSSLCIPYTLVSPRLWQKEMWIGTRIRGKNKEISIATAKKLFPSVDLRRSVRCKKDDDNIADSLLLAMYGARKRL